MPELPEVETTCRGIKATLEGNVVHNILIRRPTLRWPIPKELLELKNITINTVQRRAKYILLNTNSGTIIIHLGMTGKLRILNSNIKPEKHDHVDFKLNNDLILIYNDPRRFGAVLWTTADPMQYLLLKDLGPEPLSTAFNTNYLFKLAANKTIAVKKLLMDQKVVVGVGNIYANEALFIAGISPNRLSNSLDKAEWTALIKTTQTVLKKAIKQGGTTLRNFFAADGKPGYFKQQLLVYGRAGQPCIKCQQALIGDVIGQRQTVYCASCQK